MAPRTVNPIAAAAVATVVSWYSQWSPRCATSGSARKNGQVRRATTYTPATMRFAPTTNRLRVVHSSEKTSEPNSTDTVIADQSG